MTECTLYKTGVKINHCHVGDNNLEGFPWLEGYDFQNNKEIEGEFI